MSKIHEVTLEEEKAILDELLACEYMDKVIEHVEKTIGKENMDRVNTLLEAFDAAGEAGYEHPDFARFHEEIRYNDIVKRHFLLEDGDFNDGTVLMYLGIICQVKRTGSIMA